MPFTGFDPTVDNGLVRIANKSPLFPTEISTPSAIDDTGTVRIANKSPLFPDHAIAPDAIEYNGKVLIANKSPLFPLEQQA
jgi:hypothetical protein